MRLLLTGSTGFIGRNMLIYAVGQGCEVLAPVRDRRKLARQLESEGVEEGAVTPLPAEPREWNHVEFDAMVHCAGALFENSLDQYLETNVYWTYRVLKQRHTGCPTVILSSQSAGGPTPEGQVSRAESHPDDPRSQYGESKLRMERLVRREFEGEPIAILRPPMVLGARDTATLQLYRMVASPIRPKPGLKPKTYSFIAINDLIEAIEVALFHSASLNSGPLYVASRQTITDRELIEAAARAGGKKGIALPLPDPFIRLGAALVDRLPGLQKNLPSLTRDRVGELWPDRWVVNPSAFETATGWYSTTSAFEAISDGYQYAREQGLI